MHAHYGWRGAFVGAAILGDYLKIEEGDEVKSTGAVRPLQ